MLEKNTQERKCLSLKTHRDWVEKFRYLHIKFLAEPKINRKEYLYKRDFFIMLIREMVESFKEENIYYNADESFMLTIMRKGKGREKGVRYVSKENLVTFQLGNFPEGDNTYSLLFDIMFSIAKQENMKNLAQYSMSYFFLDIVNFLEKNYKLIVKKYKM